MKLTIDRAGSISIVRVGEARLMYPLLSAFAESVSGLLAESAPQVVIDMSQVGYVDSASIGCLMDLFRQAAQAGGAMKLAGVQKRVETMLTMTGAQHFIEMHPDEATAIASFEG